MIISFQNKGLKELFVSGKTRRINPAFHRRLLYALDAVHAARHLENLDMPGFRLHSLRGFKPVRYSISINGPWRLTFEFKDGEAYNLDFENYH